MDFFYNITLRSIGSNLFGRSENIDHSTPRTVGPLTSRCGREDSAGNILLKESKGTPEGKPDVLVSADPLTKPYDTKIKLKPKINFNDFTRFHKKCIVARYTEHIFHFLCQNVAADPPPAHSAERICVFTIVNASCTALASDLASATQFVKQGRGGACYPEGPMAQRTVTWPVQSNWKTNRSLLNCCRPHAKNRRAEWLHHVALNISF